MRLDLKLGGFEFSVAYLLIKRSGWGSVGSWLGNGETVRQSRLSPHNGNGGMMVGDIWIGGIMVGDGGDLGSWLLMFRQSRLSPHNLDCFPALKQAAYCKQFICGKRL